MLSHSPMLLPENSVENKNKNMDTPEVLDPKQVRVGYNTHLSSKDRHEWLKTRQYSQTKPSLTSLVA